MEITLADEQKKSVEMFRDHNMVLFSGPPGSGKTFTLAYYLNNVCKVPRESRLYVAPTGKAAARFTEALHAMGMSSTATTIHAALEPRRGGQDGDGWAFNYTSQNPLPHDLIVVDESSMIDSQLMASLLGAIRTGTKIILAGDPDQLPPVGPGKPFLDMIASGNVPHAELTEIHRFAGRGAQVCQEIRAGRLPVYSQRLSLTPNAGPHGAENCMFIQAGKAEKVVRLVMEQIWEIDKLISQVHPDEYDITEWVQVICARNDTGGVSRTILNDSIQNELNPDGLCAPNTNFRLDDKVMCLRNQHAKLFEIGDKGPEMLRVGGRVTGRYLANGETGRVTYLDGKKICVQFSGSEYSCQFPVSRDLSNELTLAYAVTAHKSQGGGWPFVIIVVDPAPFVDRSLVYTAHSRFQTGCVVIGDTATLKKQIAKNNVDGRKTMLAESLTEYGRVFEAEWVSLRATYTGWHIQSQSYEFSIGGKFVRLPAVMVHDSVEDKSEPQTIWVRAWAGIEHLESEPLLIQEG